MIRLVSCVFLFFGGLAFGMYGAKDPITFPQVCGVLFVLAGIALQAWDYIDNN